MLKKVSFIVSLCSLFLFTFLLPDISAQESFTDVDTSNSHYEGIMDLTEKNIINGYQDGTFKPGKKITRSQTAALFTKALNLPKEKFIKVYRDIDEDHEYADQIISVWRAGIFSRTNHYFNDGPLTREQMATVLVKAFDMKDTGSNIDVYLKNVSPSHKNNVKTLAQHGITNQLDNFRPAETVTRGQFATFLYRTMELVDENEQQEPEKEPEPEKGNDNENIDESGDQESESENVEDNIENKTYPIKQGASLTEVENFLNRNYGSVTTPMGNLNLSYEVYHQNDDFGSMPEVYKVYIRYGSYTQSFLYTIDKYQSKFNENIYRIELDEKELSETISTLKGFQKEIYSVMKYVYPNKNLEGEFYDSWYRYPTLQIDLVTATNYSWKNYREFGWDVYDVGFFFTGEWTAKDELDWIDSLE